MLRKRWSTDATATPRPQRRGAGPSSAGLGTTIGRLLLWVGLHAWHLLWTTLWQFGFLALAVMVMAALMAGTRLEGGELRSGELEVDRQWAEVLRVLRMKAGDECHGAEWIREDMAAQGGETEEGTAAISGSQPPHSCNFAQAGTTAGGTHGERLQVAMVTSRLAVLLWLEVMYPLVNRAAGQIQELLALYAPWIQETAAFVGRVVWKQAVHAGMVGWRLGAQIAVMTVARVRRATVAELVTVSAVVMLIAMVAHAWRKRYASRTKEATRRAMRSLKANISGLYQKYMQRWWLRARATTRAFYSSWKHVGYVAASAWSLWMFPKAVSFVARSSWIHPILMTTFPAGASLRALSSHQYLPQDEWLVFWCLRAAYLLAQELPFVTSTISRLPQSSELALCLELWMLLVRRSSEVRRALFGLFGHALGWKPVASTRGSHRASAETAMARVGATISTMLRMLRATGLVPARLVESGFALKERFHGLAALSLVFFFTPGFVTRYGCLLVGVLHPTHLSLTALHERQPLLIKRMLSSWIASVTVMAAYRALVAGVLLGWMPFSHHVELLLTLWLILGGADQAVNFTLRLGRELNAARTRVNQEIHMASRPPLRASSSAKAAEGESGSAQTSQHTKKGE